MADPTTEPKPENYRNLALYEAALLVWNKTDVTKSINPTFKVKMFEPLIPQPDPG